MKPVERLIPRNIKSFVLRQASWLCVWTLLTGVTEAAEFTHQSFAGEMLHYVGLHLNTVMMAMWIFVLGSCIGSFLNVVIYRMPAGIALSHPASRCPVCETKLSVRDNVPILGWLILRGRCRYCQVPISSRYPVIEFTVGLLFLTVLLVETNTGAANLPLEVPIQLFGGTFDTIFPHGHPELPGWFAAHVFYLTLALAVCMIGFDGHSPPVRLIQTGVVVGLIAGTLWPQMRPIHALHPMPEPLLRFWGIEAVVPQWFGGRPVAVGISLVGLMDGLAGSMSGLLTGWLAGNAVSRSPSLALTVSSVFLLAGVFCGWQMTWPMLAMVLISICILNLFNEQIQWNLLPLILFVICCVLLLAWSQLLNGVVLISSDGWEWTPLTAWIDWVVTAGILVALALALSRFQSGKSPDQ